VTLSDKKELIGILVQDYVAEREKNKVWGRENSSSYTFTKGKLVGACMALELEIEETKNFLIIKSRKKTITKIEFDK
jgi:hypothetical protein